ncbi:MAG: hypothetical protein ACR2H1_08605 [Limisphaerales bacterium]
MNHFQKTAYLVFALIAGVGRVAANTSGTPESIAIQNVRFALHLFEKSTGSLPTNWVQFEKFFSLEQINERSLKGSPAYPLQEHYVFLYQKIPMLGYEGGDAFLIRAEPLLNTTTGNRGRYILSRNSDGFRFNWYTEEKVQQMLAKAGVKELPKPEPWPPATNNAVHSQSPPTSNSVEPDVKPPRDQKLPSTFQPPQNTNPTNEVVAVAPSPKEKSWWPVIIILGIGLVFLLALVRRRKK